MPNFTVRWVINRVALTRAARNTLSLSYPTSDEIAVSSP